MEPQKLAKVSLYAAAAWASEKLLSRCYISPVPSSPNFENEPSEIGCPSGNESKDTLQRRAPLAAK